MGGSAAAKGLAPAPSPPRRGLARLPPAPLRAETVQRCALTRRCGPGRVAAPAGLLEPGRPSLPPQHRPRRLYPRRVCFHSRRWRPKWRRAKGRPRPLGWGAGAVTGRAAASRGPRAPLGPRLRAGQGRAPRVAVPGSRVTGLPVFQPLGPVPLLPNGGKRRLPWKGERACLALAVRGAGPCQQGREGDWLPARLERVRLAGWAVRAGEAQLSV